MVTFFDQTKSYSTQKKRLFQMAYFIFHETNYWESSNLTNSKINPSMENHAHFISCKPPKKNHPREYFGTTLCFIQIATSVVEKSQILSVAFHLSPTVPSVTVLHYGCIQTSCVRDQLSYVNVRGWGRQDVHQLLWIFKIIVLLTLWQWISQEGGWEFAS